MAWKNLHRLGIVATLMGVFFIGSAPGQNLVPNPSFEEYDFCSSSGVGLGWADQWIIPSQGYTPDYFNSCSLVPGMSVPSNVFGIQEPVSGDAYIGLVLLEHPAESIRDAVTCQLTSPLVAGQRYVMQMYTSLSDLSSHQVSTLGFLLDTALPNGQMEIVDLTATFSYAEPLDSKTEWMLITDTLTAQGGERYLTISNFMPDGMSDSVYVGGGTNGYRAYYYIDDVSIIPLDSLLSANEHSGDPNRALSLYPNPNNGQFTVAWELEAEQTMLRFEVFDLTGRLIRSESVSGAAWGQHVINLGPCQGLYLFRVSDDTKELFKQKLLCIGQ